MPDAREMPRYRSHKEVHALQIAVIDGIAGENRFRLTFFGGYAPRIVDASVVSRYMPNPGDYFVIYDGDGYESISPAAAFESGYTRID